MPDNPNLDEVTRKLGELAQRNAQFQQEIADLQRAVYDLKRKEIAEGKIANTTNTTAVVAPVTPPQVDIPKPAAPAPTPPVVKVKRAKTPLEEFIGTNLLNKIGIAVLVIGVGIGVEYAIDHDLIDPLTRIILGYFCGVILLGLAIRLKPKYANFSSVLLSGGLAVFYFITFAAYDLYHKIPQSVAFGLMVLFTAFTVFAAIQYNMVVIAMIGLVGAYAVPFLLSDGSGQVTVLFSYMTIINTGILVLGFRKAWKHLFYTAFILSWLIFATWYFDQYHADQHLWTALLFSSIFFVTFYVTLLAYKLIRSEKLGRWDIVLLLTNSFVYFGFGYDAIESAANGDTYLGIFTLFNAVLHFAACLVIFKQKGQSKDIFLFAAGLVLVFITLAVPVQLEGNWVTIIWAAEAAVLFWIGRTKSFPVYEKLSYVLMVLAVSSLVQDWSDFYGTVYTKEVAGSYITPLFNVQFLTSLLTSAAFALIWKTSGNKKFEAPFKPESSIKSFVEGAIPAVLLLTLFMAFYLEIDNYWGQRFADSQVTTQQGGENTYHSDYDLTHFKTLWLLNYSALFVLLLAVAQLRWIRNKVFGIIIFAAAGILLFTFITSGLEEIAALLVSYLNSPDDKLYTHSIVNVLMRYITIAFFIPLLWATRRLSQGEGFEDPVRKGERIFFHIVILALLSSELVNGLALVHVDNSDKLVLSILWGAYALALIVYGLMKELKYIRIAAISLFGITLIKLFFYDFSSMGTIAKTIVMIVLGALLLVASFLYNKFKKPTNVSNE